MSITIRPQDLANEAKEGNIVLNAAMQAVRDNASGIDAAGAVGVAEKVADAYFRARARLAVVRDYPEARKFDAQETLDAATETYRQWASDIDVHEQVYMAGLYTKLGAPLSGTDALIARADLAEFLNNPDRNFTESIRLSAASGGNVARLVLSGYLDTLCAAKGADVKVVRMAAIGGYVQANPQDATAKAILSAPAKYGRLKAAMSRIAAELPNVLKSDFALRALRWGMPQQ
ncbi:hypothetical protein [Streptomyces gossypiisoli]|uniref:hypothetical protein n=1 Tax=Streptomyces gossypiisoli TaxID=2748864 RepID=UPI0015D9894D|nr:hypothetical protein [Streptomyces gossypiisoli]